MALFTFSALDQKHSFWANLVQKIIIVSLSWNLVPRLIRICRIQCYCSLFLFYIANTLFGKRYLMKRDYCLCDLTGVDTLKQEAVVNMAFLFYWGECALGLFLGTAIKILNNLKRKQTFYFTWIKFLLKKLSWQILIELFM